MSPCCSKWKCSHWLPPWWVQIVLCLNIQHEANVSWWNETINIHFRYKEDGREAARREAFGGENDLHFRMWLTTSIYFKVLLVSPAFEMTDSCVQEEQLRGIWDFQMAIDEGEAPMRICHCLSEPKPRLASLAHGWLAPYHQQSCVSIWATIVFDTLFRFIQRVYDLCALWSDPSTLYPRDKPHLTPRPHGHIVTFSPAPLLTPTGVNYHLPVPLDKSKLSCLVSLSRPVIGKHLKYCDHLQ